MLQLKKGGTFDKIAFYDYLEYFDHVVFLDNIERFSDYANAIDILLSTRGSNQT